MSGKPHADFFRVYSLPDKRKRASKKLPAAHQTKALDTLGEWYSKGKQPKGGILVLPTGGGKTFTAVRFLCSYPLSDGYKVLWLAHTHHLLEQAFYSFGPPNESVPGAEYEVGRISEPRKKLQVRVVSGSVGFFPVHTMGAGDDVIIGTLQTLANAKKNKHPKLKEFLDSAKGKLVVVFDEAHHLPAPSYRDLIQYLRSSCPDMYLLGLTATPTHTDQKKKGWLGKLFPQGILYQVSPSQLMADQILAEPVFDWPKTHFSPDFEEHEYRKWQGTYKDLPEELINQLASNQTRNNFIVDSYVKRRERYGKTIIFADRWYQCVYLVEALQKRGIRAGAVFHHIESNPGSVEARNQKDKSDNAQILGKFRRGDLDVLVNIRMLTEGTDVPDANTVFLTRQTTSRILLTQMIGRALRGPKFGGTEEAYIVSFIDDWKHMINWASWNPLIDEEPAPDRNQSSKHPPLQPISIELVRQLARQVDRGKPLEVPFVTLLPSGWYRVEFQSQVEGSDDIETIYQLLLVFENEVDGYKSLIAELSRSDIKDFASEDLSFEAQSARLADWQRRFFPDPEEHPGNNLLQNLFHLARHMAQNEGEPPPFFAFEARGQHDLEDLARKIVEADATLSQQRQMILHEYNNPARYWQTLYPDQDRFMTQVNLLVQRAQNESLGGGRKTGKAGDNSPSSQPGGSSVTGEPSDEVKEQAKRRDGYCCLCCGETSKRSLAIDHIISRYMGGANELHNLQTLCKQCNNRKNIAEMNFMIKQTFLQGPPDAFPDLNTLKPPRSSALRDSEEWEKILRRAINLFYRCAAVSAVKIGKRGNYFYNWEIELFDKNDPAWLQLYLGELLRQVQEARKAAGTTGPDQILVKAPHKSPVSSQPHSDKKDPRE